MSIKKISLHTKIVIILVLVSVIGLGIIFSYKTKGRPIESEKKNTLVTLFSLNDARDNSVVAISSGEIESLEQVTLSSEMSGIISNVNVSIGDKVSTNQILAQFRASDKLAQLSQVQADYKNSLASKDSLLAQIETAKANHEKLILAIQNKISTAENVVQKSKNNLDFENPQEIENIIPDASNDAYIFLSSIQDTLTKNLQRADNILGVDNEYINDNFEHLLGVKKLSTLSQAKLSYRLADDAKFQIYEKMNTLSAKSEINEIDLALTIADNALSKMKTLFLDLSALLENTITDVNFTQTELDGLIASVNLSRDDISNKRTQLTNIIQSLQRAVDTKESREISNIKNKNNLEITYEKALSDLENIKKQSDADIYASLSGIKQLEVGLSSHDAMIKRALASISAVRSTLAKTVIRSPISGTVASISVKRGELVSAGKIVAEIVNTDGLQVKAFIPGNALSSIKVGGSVLVDGRAVGTILRIAPSINKITKKVEIIVSISPEEDISFLVGQFVELKVLANPELIKNKPILIPLQAVKIGAESHEVYIVNSKNIVEAVSVETGKLVGDKIEIISDLSMYDAIISEVRGIEVGQLVSIIQ